MYYIDIEVPLNIQQPDVRKITISCYAAISIFYHSFCLSTFLRQFCAEQNTYFVTCEKSQQCKIRIACICVSCCDTFANNSSLIYLPNCCMNVFFLPSFLFVISSVVLWLLLLFLEINSSNLKLNTIRRQYKREIYPRPRIVCVCLSYDRRRQCTKMRREIIAIVITWSDEGRQNARHYREQSYMFRLFVKLYGSFSRTSGSLCF